MTSLTLITNVKVQDPAVALIPALCLFAARTMKTAGQGPLTVGYKYNETLCFGGTFEPAFHLTISRPGISKEALQVESYTSAFNEFLEHTLGVPRSRGYISFLEAQAKGSGGLSASTISQESRPKYKLLVGQ
ncbi:hypothetical protein BDV98DRAFT_588231 [Pterulicium gracile]|uniref:Tautomerase/MIF superfamily n=1 Tax=Pterulicium gracile TaxID=1884261 RepID=A0A5C3R0P9_9AGAR|nr:hypothetical protein BDV98DRAFT_588231 [Pterula gracilis]